MLFYDYDGSGKEHEVLFSAYTLMVYEQEFKKGLIEDVYGRVEVPQRDPNTTVLMDYSIDNWQSYLRALWAGLKAASDLARAEHRQSESVPSYSDWLLHVGAVDMSELSRFVLDGCNRGFFRAGAAAAEEDQQEGDAE